MKARNLGRSGLKVSPLCIGTTWWGGEVSEATAAHMLAVARDAGVNFLDTADAYGEGLAEETVGKLVSGGRHDWVIASKVGNYTGSGANDGGLSRRHIQSAVEASLKRLRTDYIDLYYLHIEDHETPLAETVAAMGALIQQGKICYFGVSNHRAWRIAEICRICDDLRIPRPAASEPYYNALNRGPEVEQLPACAYYGLGVVPYSALARGVLTGKYIPGANRPPEDSKAARGEVRFMQTEWRKESLEIAQTIRRHAEARGMTGGQFAVLWLLNNRIVTSVIVGPRTLEQWHENIGALQHTFTSEDEQLVNTLVVSGHASTPGYNDPKFPIEGRVTYTEADQATTPVRQSKLIAAQ